MRRSPRLQALVMPLLVAALGLTLAGHAAAPPPDPPGPQPSPSPQPAPEPSPAARPAAAPQAAATPQATAAPQATATPGAPSAAPGPAASPTPPPLPRIIRTVCTDRICGNCDGKCHKDSGHVAVDKKGHCSCTPTEGSPLDQAIRQSYLKSPPK